MKIRAQYQSAEKHYLGGVSFRMLAIKDMQVWSFYHDKSIAQRVGKQGSIQLQNNHHF